MLKCNFAPKVYETETQQKLKNATINQFTQATLKRICISNIFWGNTYSLLIACYGRLTSHSTKERSDSAQ